VNAAGRFYRLAERAMNYDQRYIDIAVYCRTMGIS
jgi:hypothetical protein